MSSSQLRQHSEEQVSDRGNNLRCCLACVLPCGALDLVRVVHLSGRVDEYGRAVSAGEVLAAHPNHVLSRPCSSQQGGVPARILIVSPESELELERGEIYFFIPAASLPDAKKSSTGAGRGHVRSKSEGSSPVSDCRLSQGSASPETKTSTTAQKKHHQQPQHAAPWFVFMACSFLCKQWRPTERGKSVCSPSSRATTVRFAILFLLLSGGGLATAAAMDTILPGESISGNQTLVSKNGAFELGFFNPGVGIHYFLGVRLRNLAGYSPTFWIDYRVYIIDLPRAALELFGDKLYIKEAGASLWGSSVAGNGSSSSGAAAVLLDTGDLVVRDQANSSRVLWRSFDYPGDALLPGGRLGLDTATGTNVSLTFQAFSHNGSLRVDTARRNGFVLTTDGHDTRGTFPDWMVTSQDNGRSLLLNQPDAANSTEFLQFKLGQVSLLRWSPSTTTWMPRWTFPSDCKSSGFFCGDFGACTTGAAGACKCVDGFTPSYPKEWGHGYFVTGCSRSLPLSCETDGQTEHDDSFAVLDKLQGLPYNAYDEPAAATDEDCRAACLSRCYCVAYSIELESTCKLWNYNLYNLSSAAKPPYSKIYVRLGSKLRSKRGLTTRWIVILVVGSVAATSAMLAVVLLLRSRYRTSSKFSAEGSLNVYSYAQIKKATGNFSDKLGEGGFGSVFRGTLPGSRTAVAVKNLKGLGHDGNAEKQFRAEVQTVGMIRHSNLVRLLGFCVRGSRRMLVYEYMPNGSLDAHIFSEKSGLLSWHVRSQIALDFGMAKLLGREFNAALTTIRGTMGYLAPEWMEKDY
ncbi:hypothetical protein GUJ93_ZPchr0001g30042 [Zizania palustris]|uniref:non-specific serine/threonine protein kinase n=1 Tax=Zizania palustris TaxID=103762 RepID=A0A8J5RGM3_ZIZPA|nr:hypothetical protein GUJ93_ZPchr0001g30042 [Zizania palustris]